MCCVCVIPWGVDPLNWIDEMAVFMIFYISKFWGTDRNLSLKFSTVLFASPRTTRLVLKYILKYFINSSNSNLNYKLKTRWNCPKGDNFVWISCITKICSPSILYSHWRKWFVPQCLAHTIHRGVFGIFSILGGRKLNLCDLNGKVFQS